MNEFNVEILAMNHLSGLQKRDAYQVGLLGLFLVQ